MTDTSVRITAERYAELTAIEANVAASPEYQDLQRILHATRKILNDIRDVVAGPYFMHDDVMLEKLREDRADAEKWRDRDRPLHAINADTELGALVRKMPEGFALRHIANDDKGLWVLQDCYGRTSGDCETPDEAFLRGPRVE